MHLTYSNESVNKKRSFSGVVTNIYVVRIQRKRGLRAGPLRISRDVFGGKEEGKHSR